MKYFLIILLSLLGICFYGQNKKEMVFPNIYFRPNSTDYAAMPYKVDSCFKFIISDISKNESYNRIELAMWRDSCETEQLTERRIKKIKRELSRFNAESKFKIKNLGSWQELVKYKMESNEYISTLGSMLEVEFIVIKEGTSIE